MNHLRKHWQKLSAKKQVCLHLLSICLLLPLVYIFCGCPAFTAKGAFRRAERAAMVGPSTILGMITPTGSPYDAIVLGEDSEAVYLYAMDRWDLKASELVYRQKQGSLTLLAAPGDTLFQYELQANVPIVLFDCHEDALRAELDLTLTADTFEKAYHLSADRESDGYFSFLLSTRNPGALGQEGAALRRLQEICSNSMAGNLNTAFPATVRLYDQSGALILEEELHIRSAAALAQVSN